MNSEQHSNYNSSIINLSNGNSMDLVFKPRRKNSKCIRLSKEKIEVLKIFFEKSAYPSKQDYDIYAKEINETSAKVENWFKYQRRTYKCTGMIKDFKERKILSKENEKILEDAFRESIKPLPARYRQLAQLLKSDIKPIKKWFSYRRRKLIQIKKKKITYSDHSIKSNSISDQNNTEIKKEVISNSSESNEFLANFKKETKALKNCKEMKNNFNLIIKSECNIENSSVFYTSNESHSHFNGKKRQNCANSNSNENNSNSNMENNLPSYSNDSNSNSNEQPQERNNQNASSQRNSNSNKNTSSNDNYRNSQFQTNTSSNMNFNTKVQCSANELREKGNCSQDILSNHKYPKKGKKSIRKTKTLMQSNYDSNNSSNQQKSSRDSYNLNYIIDTLTNKNMMPSNLNLNLNQEYHYKQNENSNYLKNYEINDRSIQSNNYLSNVCIPMQMGQPIMNTNQIPFNNYMNPNQLQNINPMYYQYPNSNHSNPMSIIPINNANALNNIKPQTIFLGTNMSQPNLNNLNQSNISLPNVSQPNMSNNYELVPNYMINQNPNNNSFQLVQVGMSLRPVSNFVMISTDKLASFAQNNGQNAPFYMHPVNNNVPLIPNANMVQQYNEKQNLNPSNKCV